MVPATTNGCRAAPGQVDRLREHPEAIAAASGFLDHYRGKDVPRQAEQLALTFSDMLHDRHLEANDSTYLIPRSQLLSTIGLVEEQLPGSYAEDYELLLHAARLGPIVCVKEPQSRVYLHDSSFFANRWQTIKHALLYLLDLFQSSGRIRRPSSDRGPDRVLARGVGQ